MAEKQAWFISKHLVTNSAPESPHKEINPL